ncbi:predicted protein [Pyrenophora tritici-repentis Pt-1C-BFP]|uniref:Uncharacterized protein n=1 Tax=Pyrenophora tritici-repentis (strain Pt-1C-BFP) TaxID=426418 RepID=B2VYU5_PYRTR|nr:uncharacterized protein PTRG_02585 [Pyrenophora tritici-repentis Pt-1C-BFP]EDU45108.1 predicted protein [Pyrenophora tritici-repentis Pt-1C-BFP]
MDILGAHALVKQLLSDRPDKAHDILVRCCEDERVRQEITSCLLQSRRRQYEASPPSNRFDIAQSASTSVHSPDHIASPLQRQTLPRHLSSNAPTYPLSPARTASSVTSHSTRDESGSGEYIVVPVFGGASKGDTPIRMKTAPIKYSVIRDDVVVKRKLNVAYSLSPAEEQEIYVPCRMTGNLQLVSVEWCIELTWRRPDSEATHSTMFYVVPKDRLGPDMLLGFEDSGEEIQGVCARFSWNDD